MSRQRARTDYFSRHPHRIRAALRNGDLTYAEAALLDALIRLIDRGDRGPADQKISATLSEIAAAIRWTRTEDYLSKLLRRVRSKGWIAFEAVNGQRSPFELALTGAAIDGKMSPLSDNPLSEVESEVVSEVVSEVSSDNTPHEPAAIAVPTGDSGEDDLGQPRARARSKFQKPEPAETSSLRSDVSRDGALAPSPGHAQLGSLDFLDENQDLDANQGVPAL